MALVLANRVQETGTANTTVSFTLSGAVGGFQSFAVVGDTNTTFYAATDGSNNWEVGLGTYSTSGPTLTRTTIYASSNAGSAVTFVGGVTVFLTYPSGRSVNLDASGNVSALGTIASGTWNASTIPVAYGGTGVTASSGANSVMLRDANQNVAVNRLNQANTSTSAAGTTTALTAASTYSQTLTGTGSQTFTMPDATTLTTGVAFVFNNNATGTVTLQDYAAGAIGTITSGGAVELVLISNGTTAGTWDVHGYLPEAVTWGTNALALGSTVITGGTWNGGTIPTGYGGTGLTTFTGANNALYSTSSSALVAGTLPIAAGGTGVTTTPTNGQLLVGNGTNYTVATVGSGTGISTTTGAGTLTINNTGVTSLAGTLSQITTSASTGSVTLSLPSTINVNTSGSAASLSATLAVSSGGTGQTSYTDGQLLIGNSTGNTLAKAALTAGTAIGVSNGAGTITINNTGVTSAVAGTAISVSGATGAVTINNTGVTSNVAGTGVTVSGATGAVTISIGQAVATSSNVQFNSFGVGTAGSGTAGEIRATNNVTAYYSDIRLKTKIGSIVDPLGKVRQIETLVYHANETAVELGYDASVIEVGVSAQSVQAVQPEAVAPAPIDDKYLTVRYERLVPLLLESVKALEDRIIELEAKLKG